jgi:CARDB
MRQGFRPARTEARLSSWIKHRPLPRILALVMGSFLAAMGLATSALAGGHHKPPHHKPKPDLVATQATKFGPHYAVQGDNVRLSFKDATKNAKKEGHDATAGPSRTGMLLVPDAARDHVSALKLASRAVPKLHPDDSDRGRASDGISTDILPLGRYDIKVCADVKHQVRERNEHNNCRRTGRFYVVQESWRGGVHGVGVAAGAAGAEKWDSSGAHLDLEQYNGDGVFIYSFSGTVEWNDSGVNSGGCTVSGHDEKAFAGEGFLLLDYADGQYQGNVVTNRFYTISLSGGGGLPCSGTVPGPVTREILNIHDPKNLVFDEHELKGTFSTGGAEGATWRWDFF